MSHTRLAHIIRCFSAIVFFAMAGASHSYGFDTRHYASSSRLNQGTWVKVSVAESGIHFLSNSQLANMGFKNPSRVRVYGYGGKRLPDILSESTYIDDVPEVQSLMTDKGIFFYAVGPQEISTTTQGDLYLYHNPFTNFGYYFLSETEDDRRPIETTGYASAADDSSTGFFTEVAAHETDAYSPGETGHLLVGEDLKYTPSRTFTLPLTDATTGAARVGVSIFTNLISASSWTVKVNDKENKIVGAPASSSASNVHGTELETWMDVDITGNDNAVVNITLAGGSGNTRKAHVNRITINYKRAIKIPDTGASLTFRTAASSVKVENASESTRIWDVTNPLDITELNTYHDNSRRLIGFRTNNMGERTYAAFNPETSTSLPSPVFVGRVTNQNLHALENADMIIFTPEQWLTAAQSLATFRESKDGLTVKTVVQDQVFNEFSSGSPDINAFRRLLKMLLDRARANGGKAPRFALLFGRSSFDNRRQTSATASINYPLMPEWQTDEGDNDNTSYTSDDILGFLDDDSGERRGTDTLCVAIGRLPVTSLAQAKLLVEKITEYETKSPQGEWRSHGVFIADDENNGIHISQTEQMLENMGQTLRGPHMLIDKVYIDAYEYVNGQATGARDDFYRLLDDGVVWVNYVGHANSTSLSAEGILNYSDVGSLYLNKLPFIYAATCDFMRWDASTISGAEHLALTKGGGVIGAISATRPVYINQNGYLTSAMGNFLMGQSADGNDLTIGEIFTKAKNSITNDENKLRYVLLGDPAMRLVTPVNDIVVETLDDKPFPLTDDDIVLKARQDVTLKGSIRNPQTGEIIDDFSGKIHLTLYDADESVTTLGHGDTGTQSTFDQHGTRLFAGTDTISNGHFSIQIAMPAEVADNYRNATLNLYAYDNKGEKSASHVEREIYVYGTDEEALPDTIPPVIDAIYLNHPSFTNGNAVNSSPVLIAEISDNHAINMSLAGIGHWMSLSLDDGAITYNDVSNSYQPQTIQKGTIYYQLENLEEGAHSLTLRIWDSAGNSASETIRFFVDNRVTPQVFDIYTDRNPASETAHFYLVHDRPDGEMKVEFMVYDMLGRIVWTNTSSGRADKYHSYPITWNLTDNSGRRVQRGIYLYRAVLTDLSGTAPSQQVVTPAKKIAVTSR